jgi:hypothetical protein
MSKYANAGDLRTPVIFKRVDKSPGTNGYKVETEVNVFGKDEQGNDKPMYCKWVNVHGTEVLTAMQLMLSEPVTLTMRYSPLITKTLVAYKSSEYASAMTAGDELEGDAAAEAIQAALSKIRYEIISIDDVENRHVWLEVKMQRKVAAR